MARLLIQDVFFKAMKDDIWKHLEELKYLNDEAHEDNEKPYRKTFIIGGSILISVLLFSYFFFGPFHNSIVGFFRSDPVSGNTLSTEDIDIIFENDTAHTVFRTWRQNPDFETVLCLQGEKAGDTYTITNTYQPLIYEQSFSHVRYSPCDKETVIMFHTQPYKSCLASATDMRSLERTKQRNPDVIMMIMCEGNRFSVYR